MVEECLLAESFFRSKIAFDPGKDKKPAPPLWQQTHRLAGRYRL
jgi:hypothetical protein